MSKGVWWTPEEDETVLRLRDVVRLGWKEIAAKMPGRSAASCEQRYYNKLKGVRDNRPRRPPGPKPILPAVSWRKRGGVAAVAMPEAAPIAAAPPVVEHRRMPSLDHLRECAALQLRIDRQGLTAGFFGDPPPGRSALDARARAAAAGVQPPSAGRGSDVR